MKGTQATFSYSLFCYGGCSTTRYGFLFLVIEMRKAATYLLTRVLNLNKLTESKIGQCTICINISTNKYRDTIFFFTIFSIIIDIIYCDWYCIIKIVSKMDPCKTNVFLITTYPLINLYI